MLLGMERESDVDLRAFGDGAGGREVLGVVIKVGWLWRWS